MQLTLATVSEQGELMSPLPTDPTAEQLSFYADLVTFGKRVQRHRPWAQKELFLLIENAASVGLVAKDLTKAQKIFQQAVQVYERDSLSKNRIRYVVGTSITCSRPATFCTSSSLPRHESSRPSCVSWTGKHLTHRSATIGPICPTRRKCYWQSCTRAQRRAASFNRSSLKGATGSCTSRCA